MSTSGTKYWRQLSKLDRRKMRTYSSAIGYIHSIALASGVLEVSDIAISPATEKFLDKLLEKEALKKSFYKKSSPRFKSQVAMERLQHYPATLQTAIDFILYKVIQVTPVGDK